MKYIYYYLLILFVPFFVLSSCDNDDYEEKEAEIIITEAVTVFDSNGGVGSVQFISEQPITVLSDADWCTLSVEQNTIKLTISENSSINSRGAQLTLTTTNGYKAYVGILQEGVLFQIDKESLLFAVAEEANGEIKILKNSSPIDIQQEGDWFSYEYKDNSILIHAPSADLPRVGRLTISSGNKEYVVLINQTVLKYEELLGNWELNFINIKGENRIVEAKLDVKEDKKSYILSSTGLPGLANNKFPLILDFNQIDGSLNIDFQLLYQLGSLMKISLLPTNLTQDFSFNVGKPYISNIDIGGEHYRYSFSTIDNPRNGITSLTYYQESALLGSGILDEISNMTLTKLP
ncbi:BACON domain-containing protein [Dysgonomonas sp. Marseille-P4677]|uniref:BACON domain-containing protein n=1 Tax=Dysgonomonas sp. Marseille-P4677 TaxID=2364790 RepID=UPI001911E409|nr:BACON domain-containing protein [Dysgonomonas sp. Marseille-P4677]MBK5721700.1 BACON domain-containing protein [Dysgonomonas sp. Marseille-P4677]